MAHAALLPSSLLWHFSCHCVAAANDVFVVMYDDDDDDGVYVRAGARVCVWREGGVRV